MLALAPTAGAIVDGDRDTTHSYVVFIGQTVFYSHPSLPSLPGLPPMTVPVNATACSGTLIAPKVVVTAAHCSLIPPRPQSIPGDAAIVRVAYTVRQGLNYRMPSAATMGTLVRHPDFTFGGYGRPGFVTADVAVVKLMSALAGPYASLPAAGETLRANTSMEIVGYGVQDFDTGHTIVGVDPVTGEPIYSNGQTPVRPDGYRMRSDAKLLGRGGVEGFLNFKSGACLGDSGGPLLLGNVVYGVISFAPSACNSTTEATDLADPSVNAFVRSFL